ncbi:Fc.00g082050.m01.CDS01 [Cosmosporella sp. VM-42]
MSGFKKSGIFPPNKDPIMRQLLAKQQHARQATDPSFSHLLPSETRFEAAVNTLQRATTRYHDVFSSPTREGLRQTQRVVAEAAIMDHQRESFLSDYHSRLEKFTKRKRRGKNMRPSGDYVNRLTLEDVKRLQEEEQQAEAARAQRQQLRITRSLVIEGMKTLEDEWREKRDIIVNGKKKRLTKKQWLQSVGKEDEYIAMESSRKRYNDSLNPPKQLPYTLDIMPQSQERKDAIQTARYAAKPLSAMD